MLDIDTAIKHCIEVAEKNDGEAEVYDLLAKNHNNTYEKLTASRFHSDCAECAADHRQLAEWLTELKEAKRLLKAAVEDNKRVLRENFGDICQFCKHYSNSEAQCCKPHNGSGSWCCENAEWRYADEALKLIGGEEQ